MTDTSCSQTGQLSHQLMMSKMSSLSVVSPLKVMWA